MFKSEKETNGYGNTNGFPIDFIPDAKLNGKKEKGFITERYNGNRYVTNAKFCAEDEKVLILCSTLIRRPGQRELFNVFLI